jgi:phosphoglycolate phosphatase-like HAD superfamily hydrolase
MMIYGFDWDGTLVRSWTAEPVPGAAEALAELHGHKTFIATNQGGPAYRAMLDQAKYPSVADVVERLARGLHALQWQPDALLICCCAGREGAAWWRAETVAAAEFAQLVKIALPDLHSQTYLNAYYRKPQPGLLYAARTQLGYDNLVYVGDMEADREAAYAAGARYVDVAAWLGGATLGDGAE